MRDTQQDAKKRGEVITRRAIMKGPAQYLNRANPMHTRKRGWGGGLTRHIYVYTIYLFIYISISISINMHLYLRIYRCLHMCLGGLLDCIGGSG